MTELDDLLDRATDRIQSPVLAPHALAVARVRRRNRRAAIVAATATVVVVAGVVTAGSITHSTEEPRPAPPADSVAPAPTTWDLRDVADLPLTDQTFAALLPDELDVPDLAPHVEDDPVDAAVLAVDDGADVLLLGTDGAWRCVVVPGKTSKPSPVLSPGGTRLVVTTADGLTIVDVTTGVQTRRSLPEGYVPANPSIGSMAPSWLDEQRLVLHDADGDGWIVDVVEDSETHVAIPPSPEDVWVLGLPKHRAPDGWTIRPIGQLDDGTGLLEVKRSRRDAGEWWVVRWDPAGDRLELVSTMLANAWKPTSYANRLLDR